MEIMKLDIFRKIFTSFALSAAAALSFCGGTNSLEAQSLKEAVCMMLEFEPELNAAEYDTLSSREDQKIVRSKLLPHLSVNGSSGYSERDRSTDGLLETGDSLLQRRVGISLRQLLYDGGIAVNEARSSRNTFLAQQYLEKSMIETRVVDLSEVYLEVLRTKRQVALAEQNVANHERMRDMLHERVKAGGSRADLALIQGRLGLATNTLATAKLSARLAEGRFERLTGQLPVSLSYPEIPQLPGSMEAIDLSNNHDYLAASEALEAAEHRSRAAKGYNHPKIYLDGGATSGRDINGVPGDDNELSAVVVASWDIFAGGYNNGVKNREHFQVGKYEELKRTADLQRQYNLSVLWQEREGSAASIEALAEYARELDGVAADYQEQFEVGRQELLNILDVQSEKYTAQSRLLDAKFDFDTSAFRVLGVQGLATERILGPEGCKECFGADKTAIAMVNEIAPFEAADPDCRVPLTQTELMQGKFDSMGPEAEHDSLHQAYYVERQQFPLEPSADCKPLGGVFKLKRRGAAETDEVPIFK